MQSGLPTHVLANLDRVNNSVNRRARDMKMKRCAILSAAAVSAIWSVHSSIAATETWVGSTFTNWDSTDWIGGNAPPQNGDALVFAAAGASGTSLTDDFSALSIAGLTFNAGASGFSIAGTNTLTLDGNLTDNAAAVTESLSLPILLGSASTWTVTNAATTALNVSGNIDNGGNLLTLNAGNAANGAINISSVISDTGGLTINSANNTGTVTLTAANTYSGPTTIANGALLLNGGSVANSAVALGVNGFASTAVLNVTQSAAGTYTFANGLAADGAVGPGGNNSFGMILNVSGGNFIENAGSLSLNDGVLRMSLAQNTAGNTQLNFTSVTRNPGTHLSLDRNVQNAGLNVGTATIASQTAGTQNVVFATAPTLVGGGGATGTNTVSILPWATINNQLATYDSTYGLRTLTTAELATLTSGMTGLENAKISANTSLSAATTSINALYESSTSSITFGASTDTLSINSGAIVASVNLTVGGSVGSGVLALGGAEGQFFVANTRNMTVNSIITGTGGLTIDLDDFNGTTTYVNLAAPNTYSGTTTFEGNNAAMTVRLTNALALQNTTLNYNNYGASFTFGNGGTTGLTAYTFGGLEGAQNITLANNNSTAAGVALTVGGDGDSTTYSGNLLNGSGAAAGGSFTFNGTGTMTLLGVGNTYTGGTTVANGTLVLGHGGALAATNALALGNSSNSGVFQLGDATAANNTTVTSVTTSGTGANNAVVGGNAAVSTLTVNVASGTDTYAGALGGSGTNQNNFALVKAGAGDLTLSGTSPFTGGTTISAGNLNIAGNLSGAGAITVNAGALHLYSTGTIGSGTTVQVNPGATIGTTLLSGSGGTVRGLVTVAGGTGTTGGNVNLEDTLTDTLNLTGGLKVGDANGASQISMDVGTTAGSSDLINLGTGIFSAGTGGGGAAINLLPLGGSITPGTYTLMTFGSSSGLTIGSNLDLSNTAPVGKTYTLQFNTNDTALQLLVTGLASPNIAFWSGVNGGSYNWGDGATNTNWDSTQTGSTSVATPGSNTDVVFANSNATGASLNSQLEAGYSVNSITVLGNGVTSATTGTLTSIGGTGGLTISGLASGSGGEGYAAGTGIVVQSGSAGLTISTSGGVTLANTQSWTNNSASALTVSSNVQGSAAANNPTTLTLRNTSSGATTLSGAIADGSGAGSTLGITVNNTGSGITTLSGSNTFSGTTSITAGKLDLSNTNALQNSTLNYTLANSLIFDSSVASHAFTLGGLSGAANLALADNASNAVALSLGNNGASATYSGVLSGSGSFNKIGSGTQVLSNANTYTGGTTITAGVLQLGDGVANNGSVIGAITDNATLAFANPNPQTYSAVISGTGAVNVTGPGTLTLTNANTYAGNTTVTAGTLQFGDGVSNIGSVAGNIIDNAAVVFANPTAQTVSNLISGTGSVTAAGPATLVFTGANTYTGTTTVNATSTLQLGDGATNNGGMAGNAAVNGTLIFNNSTALTINGNITGNGAVIQNGAGATSLAGNSSYSGGTTLNNGSIVANSNTALGTGTITMNGGSGNGFPALGSANSATIANNISVPTGIAYIQCTTNSTFTVGGNISGPGTIYVTQNGGSGGSTFLSGDDSGFTGTLENVGNSNTRLRFGSASAGSASANFVLDNSTPTQADTTSFNFSSGTISFGSLSGNSWLRYDGGGTAATATLAVGALGQTTTFTGTINAGTGSAMTVNVVGGNFDYGSANANTTTNSWFGNAEVTGSSSVFEIDGPLNNVTDVDANGGTFDFSFNLASPFVLSAAQTLSGQGTVLGTITADGPVSLGQAVNTPGNTPATLNIAAGSTLAGSLLEDLTAANAADDLVFGGGTGSANLGGTLSVTSPNSIAFTVGQTYQILDFGSETGTFSGMTLPTLPAGLGWNTNNLYTNGTISIISVGPTSLTWDNGQGDNLWNTTSSNWNNGSANTTYADASAVIFSDNNPSNTAANYNVTLNTTVNPASITINNSAGNYTVSGTGSIAGSASLTKSGSGIFTINTRGTSLGAVSITAGSLQLGTSTGLATVTSLSITGTGTFDVNNNHVIINYGSASDPIASIAALLKTGFNAGSWNGPGGIISTAAQLNNATPGALLYGLGYADSADPGNPAHLATDTIEIKYTLLGDADLSGVVDGTDFGIVAANFNKGVTGWDRGDFNYDNVVDGTDFGDLAANFNKGASGAAVGLPAIDDPAIVAFAQANGLMSELTASVPEPTSTALAVFAGVGFLYRRKRK